jgi:WD40 repeat protein
MTTTQALPGTERDFFTIGGTLSPNAPSYVERKADSELYAYLSASEFCYVLTSRQMGKSSLMVRTAARLRREGTHVALLDLTKVGQNLTPEQWYDGLLIRLGQEFDLEDEIEDFWNSFDEDIRRMGPMQRWMSAIRRVILKAVDDNIVVFVDEIDAVRGLPFSSDEFFAGIRELYNARVDDPELNRITFCLLGVATPSDLIRNINTTPFNIGYRIALTDFSHEEAEPLIQGLGHRPEIGRKLLHRILSWTGGHPYLTQRMCAAIAGNPEIVSDAGVNHICRDLFLSSRARETDDNLLFVRERVLRSAVDRADLLDLYHRIHARKNVPDDDANRLIDVLRLAGLVAVRENRLVVRNAIYAYVFDERWIRGNMPDAELRRQRAAFRRGIVMTVGLAAIVIGAIGGLTFKIARMGQASAAQSYSVSMVQAQQDFDNGDYYDGTALLRQWLQPPQNKSIFRYLRPSYLYERLYDVNRGFEWGYLLGRADGDSILTYTGHEDEVRSIAISPDGSLLATAGGSNDSTVRIFDIRNVDLRKANPQLLRTLFVVNSNKNNNSYLTLPPSSDSDCSVDEELAILEKQSRGHFCSSMNGELENLAQRYKIELKNLPGVISVEFSPDGAWVAIATGTWRANKPGTVYLWSTQPPYEVRLVATDHHRALNTITFRNNTEFATSSNDNTSEFWRIAPNTVEPDDSMKSDQIVVSDGVVKFDASGIATSGMNASAYSPDGSRYAMIFGDGHLWINGNQRPIMADVSGLMSMAFYDNNRLLLGSRDGRILCFDLRDEVLKPRWVEDSGQGLVTSLTISKNPLKYSKDPDKKLLITTGNDGTVRLWQLWKDCSHIDQLGDPLRGHRKEVLSANMSADQSLIVSGDTDQDVRFWTLRQTATDDGVTYAAQQPSVEFGGAVKALAYKPHDGTVIAGLRGFSSETSDNEPADIIFYDIRKPDEKIVEHLKYPGTALAWSPDGKYVATAESKENDATVLLWNSETHARAQLEAVKDDQGHPIPISALSFSPDGVLAGAGNATNKFHWKGVEFTPGAAVFFWKWTTPTTLELQKVVQLQLTTTLRALTFSPVNGELAMCGFSDNKIRIWKTNDLINGKPASVALYGADQISAADSSISNPPLTLQYPCDSVVFSTDGKWLAAGTSYREIRVWDTSDWKLVDATDSAAAAINALAFSPDPANHLLAAGTADSKILLWNFKTHWNSDAMNDYNGHRAFPAIAVHSGGVLTLAFSPNDDGRCIASGSTDQTMQITCDLDSNEQQDTVSRLRDRPQGTSWKQTLSEQENWVRFPLLGPDSSSNTQSSPASSENSQQTKKNN